MAVPATGGWPLPRSLWIQDPAFMRDPNDGLSRLEPFRCSLNAIFCDVLLAGCLYKKYFANRRIVQLTERHYRDNIHFIAYQTKIST
jgi:hypothetical protein